MLFFILCSVLSVSASFFPEKDLISENGATSEKVEEGRIAGGDEIEQALAPYQVQIVIKGTKFCSGAIVDKHYILTAAHCVHSAKPDEVEVRAGSVIRGQGMVVPIASIKIPKDFDAKEHYMDIAVMRTVNPFTFTRRSIEPSIIVAVNQELPDEIEVAGWGSDGYNDELSDELKSVQLRVLNNAICQVQYPEDSMTRNLFCAANSRTGGEGTCKGDGGAPAIHGIRALEGISTFARGCGADMSPSVFTRLSSKEIHDYITENMKDDEGGEDTFYYDEYDSEECELNVLDCLK